MERQLDESVERSSVDIDAGGVASEENILKLRGDLRRVLGTEERRQRRRWRRKDRSASLQASQVLLKKQCYPLLIT